MMKGTVYFLAVFAVAVGEVTSDALKHEATNAAGTASVYTHPEVLAPQVVHKARILAHSLEHLDVNLVKKLSSLDTQSLIRSAVTNGSGISTDCQNAFSFILSNMSDFRAIRFIDSWGKLGSGLFVGHSKYPGNFDECLNVTVAKPKNTTLISKDFTTNYCTAFIPIIPKILVAQLGACAPDQCTEADIKYLFNSTLGSLVHGVDAQCRKQDFSMEPGNIAALVIVLLMVAIAVFATIYEGIGQLLAQRSASGPSQTVTEATPLLHSTGSSQEQGLLSKVILSFSFYSNITKVLSTEQPPGAITCLNGIRFFSMTWVILGHTLIMYSISRLDNTLLINDLFKSFATQAIMNATVSVDTFFVLSGLLVAYLFLKDFYKRKVQLTQFAKALPVMYLHRYLRLTPAYAFMILIYTALLWFMRDGPYWPTPSPTKTVDANCVNNWYLNILYVNNIFQSTKQCAGWGWYLANDTQFFLVAPFIVYLMYRSVYAGMLACVLTVLVSIGAAIGVSGQQHTSFTLAPTAKVDFNALPTPDLGYYFVPWTRYQTYGIGLLAGFLIFKFKRMGLQISTVLNLVLWGVSAGVCMAVVYGPYGANMGYHTVYLGEADAYNGLSRSAWAIGISYVMIACSLGQGGWVNDFLSWRGFVPLSRLTYSAYLIHIPIMAVIAKGFRNGIFYTRVDIAQDVIMCVTMAYLVAFPFSLLFEVPFINLDKLFLTPKSIKKDRHVEETATNEAPPKYQQISEQTDQLP